MIGIGEAAFAASRPLGLEVVEPCWLIAVGDTERVEVLRSPLVSDDDEWMQPVRRYTAANGLVLAARETFEDADFMHGEVEVSVYVPPRVRNATYGVVSTW